MKTFLHNWMRRIPAAMKVAQIICQAAEIKIPFLFDNVGADTFTQEENENMLDVIRAKFGPDVQQQDLQVVGCGTIGRVFRYKDYALKVKIPGVLERIERDLVWMERIATWLDYLTLYKFFFQRKIKTVHDSICRQNDFAHELQNGLTFIEQMRKFDVNERFIFAPTYFPQLCTENMIVMSFVDGVTIASLENPKAEINEPVREELHKFLLYNLALFSVCHADLHVGNMIIERVTRRLAVIDFGMCVPRLPVRKIIVILRLLQAAQVHDACTIARIIALEYYYDRKVCVLYIPHLFDELEYEVVRTYHSLFDKSELYKIDKIFAAVATWSLSKNVWGSREMADVEVAAVVSLSNLSVVGLVPEMIKKYSKKVMEIERLD
jgi:predicted unusual protein kinase regulating ubiquinone biosynthesis (AarF/ABC1/UbiB family)